MGDAVYGGGGSSFEARHKKYICGQCLFAAELHLTHPKTKENKVFCAPLPDSFEKLLEILRSEAIDS